MRLAFVTSLVPARKPDTGFEIANAAIVEALRAAGHSVTVIGFARPDDELPDDPDRLLLGRLIIENHEASAARKALWLGAALAFGLPVACAKLRLQGAKAVEDAVRAAGPFDALVLNSVTMAGAFPGLRRIAPFLLVEHNIEHVSAAQNASHASGPMRALFARRLACSDASRKSSGATRASSGASPRRTGRLSGRRMPRVRPCCRSCRHRRSPLRRGRPLRSTTSD